ncbi:hypothetical protein BH10ACT1_BH10ACT1_37340 [soil metagenome]
MPPPPRQRSRQPRSSTARAFDIARLVPAIAVLAGLGALFAPVGFTGSSGVDAIERALLATGVAFVGAHGHRRTWFLIGALAAVPARGTALALVVLALVVAAVGTRTARRSKPFGAVTTGLLVNGVLWYPAQRPGWLAPAVGIVVVAVIVGSGLGELRAGQRRLAITTVLAAGLLVVVALGTTGWAAVQSRGDIEAGTSGARAALASVRRGDTEKAQEQLAEALGHLRQADDRLNAATVLPAAAVPGLAQQVHAVQVAVHEGIAVSDAASALVATDYDSLRYDGKLDLDQVATLSPRAERVRDALAGAERRLGDLRHDRLIGPLRSRVDDFRAEVVDARSDADLAADLLDTVPGLLGSDGDRRYLIVFLQPSELRGSGGFVGNWAELTAKAGDVDLSRSGRIAELIEAAPDGTRTIDGPEDYVARYGRDHPTDNLQDVTLSPDWPSVASVYAQLYPQSGGAEVDGVIGIDPKGLAALLQLTGPVRVDGLDQMLTAENAVPLLTLDQYLVLGDRAARSEILEAATRATFAQLTSASLPAPRVLGDVLGPAARGRHLQLWSPEPREEQLFERLRTDGRLLIPEGQDGLSVFQQNVGNSKIDAYLHRSIAYRAVVDARTGSVTADVKITIRNEIPVADLASLPRDVAGNNRGLPNGTSLAMLSVATPQAVTGATIDGRALRLAPSPEAGTTVWDLPLLSIPPGGAVEVTLRLAGGLDLAGGYRFRYLPQPVVNPDELTASVSVEGGRFTDADADGRLVADGPVEERLELRSGVRR